mgnify:CR=1 FL=1
MGYGMEYSAPTEQYHLLFEAFLEAREAYVQLEGKGTRLTDQELARDRDYHRLHVAGRKIVHLGGKAALSGATRALFPEDEQRTHVASIALERYWAGFGTWTN